MQAITIPKFGKPEVLTPSEVDTPSPKAGELRVRVRATAVNRADILQRMGFYPAPPGAPQNIPGLEFAGEVDALGEDVGGFAIGDRVFGLVQAGSYAEYLVTDYRTVARIPNRLGFTEAAAFPEAFVTAYDAMVSQGGLQPGEVVLINAIGSGVGIAGAQIATAIGATAVGTARTEGRLERAKELGLAHGICVNQGEFAEAVRQLFPNGVNVVLELVGGNYLLEDLKCIAKLGRIVVVGLLGGTQTKLDLLPLINRRARIFGTVLRSRPLEERILTAQVLSRNLVPLVEAGALNPTLDRIFPLEDAAQAHEYVQSNQHFGKVVLQGWQ